MAFNFDDSTTAGTCCHEAGHAIVGGMLGLPVAAVVLADANSGMMKQKGWVDPLNYQRRMAATALAGPLAEHFYFQTRGHIYAKAAAPDRRMFLEFALEQSKRRGQAVDLERVAKYVRGQSQRVTYQRRRKLFDDVHRAITAPATWQIIGDLARALCRKGVLIDDELQPFIARAVAVRERFGFFGNL